MPSISTVCKAESISDDRWSIQNVYSQNQDLYDRVSTRHAARISQLSNSFLNLGNEVKRDIEYFTLHFRPFGQAYNIVDVELLTNSEYSALSRVELASLRLYTTDGERLNLAIREQSFDGASILRGFKDVLDEALAKMPDWSGDISYRGCGPLESEMANEWSVDDIINFADYKSASKNMDEAIDVMQMSGYGPRGVVYEISATKAPDISAVSAFPEQEEVLFRAPSSFKVIGKAESLIVYPNPANDEVNLDFSLNVGASVRFQLVDVSGKLILEKEMELSAGHQTIRLSGLIESGTKPGIYFLSVNTNDFNSQTKLILE